MNGSVGLLGSDGNDLVRKMKRSHSRQCRLLVTGGRAALAAVTVTTFPRTGTHDNWWLDNDLFLEWNMLNRRRPMVGAAR